MGIEEHIAYLLQNNLPFAAWKMPGSEKVMHMAGSIVRFDPEGEEEGFLFYPFDDTTDNPLLLIESGQMPAPVLPDVSLAEPMTTGLDVDFPTYIDQVAKVLCYIRRGVIRKLVLSRRVQAPGISDALAARYFTALCKHHPEAYVYIFSDGSRWHWMGATPETLVNFRGKHGSTVALAGTLPAGQSLDWSPKEHEEQQIVTDYILNVLSSAGASELSAGEPTEINTGHLIHLKTHISFTIPEQLKRFDIVRALHPTPAVCGTPRDAAMQLIRKIEKHRRGYYTGFLGYWSTKADTQLFVNLRCMQFSQERSLLYVGGGITASSIAEREWAETEWKSKTLSWLFGDN